jgi:hypothetical protein
VADDSAPPSREVLVMRLHADLVALAEREMPCTCLPEYLASGVTDPECVHDRRDRLVTAVLAWVGKRVTLNALL